MTAPERRGPERPGPDYPPEWDNEPNELEEARLGERRRIIGELRDFADDLYGLTGARWIADSLTATLDRLGEDGQP